jgi:hypothetical protein
VVLLVHVENDRENHSLGLVALVFCSARTQAERWCKPRDTINRCWLAERRTYRPVESTRLPPPASFG